MKQVTVVAMCLFAGSALVAACSGFSSSSETTAVSDGGDGALVGESGVIGDSAADVDSGATPPGLDEAGCPAEIEQADAGNRVFVATAIAADFGGVVGANAICQRAGEKFGGKWHAWVSTSRCPASARFVVRDRYLAVDGGYVGKIGRNSPPTQPIDVSDLRVWTGTDVGGAETNEDCAGWTSKDGAMLGTQGSARNLAKQWTEIAVAKCDGDGRLYCFEL